MMKNKAVAYVDGSYNKKEDLCGWGVVFLYEDEAPEYFSGSYKGIHWNVTGEINAAVYAVEKALEYRDKMRGFFGMIDIGFVHVKSHSGDEYNDKADELAKTGAGILEETFAEDAKVKEPAKKGKKTKDLT